MLKLERDFQKQANVLRRKTEEVTLCHVLNEDLLSVIPEMEGDKLRCVFDFFFLKERKKAETVSVKLKRCVRVSVIRLLQLTGG